MAALRLFRRQRLLLVGIVVVWVAALLVCFAGTPWLVNKAYDGQSVEFLNRKFEGHRKYRETQGLRADRDWYLAEGREYAYKAAGLATGGAALAAAFVAIPGVRRRVRRFLFASSAPLNLAVLRIVVFGTLLYLLATEPILEYAAWPHDLYQWPAVGGSVLKHLPISVDIVQPLLALAFVATTMAVLGLVTRTSAFVSVMLAIYLLGIPQYSGKVNHMHHVVLIGFLLSLSRCGDALSFDSIRLAVRRADRGEVGAPRRAVRYGLPIRLSMALLALIYFFPGFWKLASNGPSWIFSDNLHNQLLQKWFQLEYYEPPLPIHKLPFASQMGALTAVVFEIGFPLAILWSRSRALWAVLGLTFHNLTRVLMNISFMTLQAMYVMFVDWQRLLAWLGRRMFGGEMVVLYDNHCKLCRRTVSILDSLDWLEVVRPISAFERDRIEALGLGHLDHDALMQDMHAAWRGADGEWRVAKGYAAYQALAWRVPKLWFSLPIVYLPPVVTVGGRVYRRVADSRACQVADNPASTSPTRQTGAWWPKPLLVTAAALMLVMAALGVGRVRKAWPVACYPLFDQIATNQIVWPEFTAVTSDGRQVILDDDPIRDRLGSARYVESLQRFLESPEADQRRRLLSELLIYWRDAGSLEGVEPTSLLIHAATYELQGTGRPRQAVSRELLAETNWADIEGRDETIP